MRRVIAISKIAALAAVSAACLPAAAPVYRVQTWTIEQGLPINAVNSLAQTPDGYLWLTTTDGLVRFDGLRFTTFNKSTNPEISSNRMNALCAVSDGTLWIGTEANGVIRYQGGKFTSFTTANGLLSNSTRRIMEDDRGRLLVLGSRLTRWNGSRFEPDESEASNRAGARVYLDNLGHVWRSEENNLYRWSANGETVFPVRTSRLATDRLTIRQSQDGGIWVGIESGGLHYLRDGNDKEFTEADGLTDRRIRDLYVAPSGAVRILTEKQIWEWNHDRITLVAELQDGEERRFKSLFVDRQNSTWLSGTGLHLLRAQILGTFGEENGLSAGNIYPILEDRSGAVWVGAWPGLNRIQNGKAELIHDADGSPKLVSSLAEDREGNLWVAAFPKTVYKFTDGKLSRLALFGDEQVNGILAILPDRAGRIWFGTNIGVFLYQNETLQAQKAQPALWNSRITAILEDRNSAIWFGTAQGVVSWKDGKATSYAINKGPGSLVRCLYEDADGTIWIGTYDGGLARLKNGRVATVGVKDGLYDPGVFQILEDASGFFWMSCNRGIYRVRRQELSDLADGKIRMVTSVPYGKEDGMLNPETNGGMQPAGWRRRNGELWFPTQHGVVMVHPELVPPAVAAPVRIEAALIDGQAAPVDRIVEVLPSNDNLEIEYTAITFLHADRSRFRYKMLGLDRDWVEAGTRRVAYYPHIPPGHYTFQVMAADWDGVWSSSTAQLAIQVTPPFWRTRTAMVLAALLVLGAAAFLYRMRIGAMQRKQEALEIFSRKILASQEAERKRIAAELHDGLGQHLLVIKNQSLVMLQKGEAGREGLEEISSTASQALAEVRTITYDLRPYALDRTELSRAIESMTGRVSKSSGVPFFTTVDSVAGVLPRDVEIGLYRIAQEAVNNIVRHAAATQARVELRRSPTHIDLVVADNGRGFRADGNGTGPSEAGGSGLIGITERARLLGGLTTIQSAPGEGTTISVRLNCKRAAEEN